MLISTTYWSLGRLICIAENIKTSNHLVRYSWGNEALPLHSFMVYVTLLCTFYASPYSGVIDALDLFSSLDIGFALKIHLYYLFIDSVHEIYSWPYQCYFLLGANQVYALSHKDYHCSNTKGLLMVLYLPVKRHNPNK